MSKSVGPVRHDRERGEPARASPSHKELTMFALNSTARRLAGTALLTALAAAGAAHAAPASYTIDPAHTYPSFEADHFGGLSTWRGKFNSTTGKVTLDKAAGTGSVDITVDTASIDFGLDKMNEAARGNELFDVTKYPKATYHGKLTGFVNGAPTKVTGELTLHGVTRPLDLTLNSFKCMPHPMYKRELCGADAVASFKRDEFGMDSGKGYGFKMDVLLRIQVEALIDDTSNTGKVALVSPQH
jgi:polyisoprenoid-binding protein YceI